MKSNENKYGCSNKSKNKTEIKIKSDKAKIE